VTTLYLTEPGTTVSYDNQTLTVRRQQQSARSRLAEVTLHLTSQGQPIATKRR
jgi:hypothetical protein